MAQKTIDFENDILRPIGSLKRGLADLDDNKITKFYTNNNGDTVLNDSDDGKIQDLMIYGKSEQKQYKGINLLNYKKEMFVKNGVTFMYDEKSQTYKVNGTAAKQTSKYLLEITENIYAGKKIVGCPGGGSNNTYCIVVSYFDDAGTWKTDFIDTGNGNIIQDYPKLSIYIVVRNGVTVDNRVFKPMIVEDTTKTYDDFEPYVGGKPSPNPEYPQEIKAVVNPMVKVRGKNIAQKIVYGYINQNNSVQIDNMSVSCVAYLVKDNTYTVSSKVEFDRLKIGRIDESDIESLSGAQCEVFINDLSTSAEKNFKSPFTGYAFIYINTSKNDTLASSLQIEFGSTATSYQPYTEQTATLPYTLNAIPVSSGGNVTIDGQQYIADYVDIEKGVLVRKINSVKLNGLSFSYEKTPKNQNDTFIHKLNPLQAGTLNGNALCKYAIFDTVQYELEMREDCRCYVWKTSLTVQFKHSVNIDSVDKFTKWLESHSDASILYVLATQQEISLTQEEIIAFKALATYYPKTYVNAESEQLEAYTMFNYPVSMEKGWEYVKQQIGDTRKYVYDMDTKTQDIDTQSAEAYVNSEYAVALTELEV